jgi:hypothetical protein
MMPPTIIKACYGCVLTPEESYKIDKTVMADIVNLKDNNGQPLPSVKDRKYEEEGEEGDMIQSLEDILRACDDTEQKNDSNEEVADNSELIPYKTDLEYLEDNLEVFYPIHLSTHLSTQLSIHPFIHPSIHSFIHSFSAVLTNLWLLEPIR